MIYYHGSSKNFDQFDPALIGSAGTGSTLTTGFYLTTNASVADGYRQLTVEGSTGADMNAYLDGNHIRDASELGSLDEVEEVEWHKGALYAVSGPEHDELLDWEGGLDAQPFDVVEMLKDIYGQDSIDEIYDEAYETLPLGMDDDTFDEAFSHALVTGDMSELYDLADDYDWSKLVSVIDGRDLGTSVDSDVGRMVHATLTHQLASHEACTTFLKEYGVRGLISNTSPPSALRDVGYSEVVVVWDAEDLTIRSVICPQDASQQPTSHKHEPSRSPGHSLEEGYEY